MTKLIFKGEVRIRSLVLCVTLLVLLGGTVPNICAAGWNGIEPLKSTRADVERILSTATPEATGPDGSLRFKVAGGTATIAFVDSAFVAAKRLSASKQGTVRQIVLQHDASTDTPESLGLINSPSFEREEKAGVIVFRNRKAGIAYTFIAGTLKTTYFLPASAQLPGARNW